MLKPTPARPAGTGRSYRRLATGIAVALLALVAFIYSGFYDIGADSPHARPVTWLLETLRDRSIAAHAGGVLPPPNLNDPGRISAGAGLYAETCAACHLAPGMRKTGIARGLYPAAPDFANGNGLSPREQFWVIKHGIEDSGMAAWGKTRNDDLVWDLVAFLRDEGSLSPEAYRALVASARNDHVEMPRHSSNAG